MNHNMSKNIINWQLCIKKPLQNKKDLHIPSRFMKLKPYI